MVQFLVVLCLAIPSVAWSLATVESRRGEPVVRSFSHTERNNSTVNVTEEDRAAHLTLKQISTLKQEVSDLRGLVETQQHEIERLKKSQQDFYVDLDKRLSQVQKMPAPTPVPAPPKVKVKSVAPPVAVAKSGEQESAAAPSHTDPEKNVYEAAYNLVRTKQYPEAEVAFQQYLTRFPGGERAPSAHFWLGEIYMAQWQADTENQALLDKATEAFLSVTSQFPTHQKVADALLKLGLVENEKGDFEAARQYFTEVKERFPSSAAARIAETRLQQLN